MGTLPLKGLTVVADEQAAAASFARLRLADAGAGVIRIERPEGDFIRVPDIVAKGQASCFIWLIRGREAIAWDLTLPEHKDDLARLPVGADVPVQNLDPGVSGRLGFGFGSPAADHPRPIAWVAFSSVNDRAGLSGHPQLRRIRAATPKRPVSDPAPGTVFGGKPRCHGTVPARPKVRKSA